MWQGDTQDGKEEKDVGLKALTFFSLQAVFTLSLKPLENGKGCSSINILLKQINANLFLSLINIHNFLIGVKL